ncbi:MAG: hypothetical protein A4E32_01396 [Methanomassiliicoccales archaeon PtaU1.Bin124]|nr:MAG: hypothetical protein A4E32_01396 [Methanomassiliicoccales archaeon PtaU1.Bin124]
MALLLDTAVFMALIGYVIGRGNEGGQLALWEKAGLIFMVTILTAPLIINGYFSQITVGAVLLALVVIATVLLIGTDAWWEAKHKLRRMHRPVVESYMLSLGDLGLQMDDSVPNAEKGMVWVYAHNSGKGKAKAVRIDTNIPDTMVFSQVWQDGMISRNIDVLAPELPVCIGVVRTPQRSDEQYWISFEYQSESEVSYRERYELVI